MTGLTPGRALWICCNAVRPLLGPSTNAIVSSATSISLDLTACTASSTEAAQATTWKPFRPFRACVYNSQAIVLPHTKRIEIVRSPDVIVSVQAHYAERFQ